MDVAELACDVFAANQVTGVWSALTTTGWLSLNNNPEALGGGIRTAGEGAIAVGSNGCGTPASRNGFGCNGINQDRTVLNRIACGETLY